MHCKLGSRKRFTARFVRNFLKDKQYKNVFLYEQVTRFYQAINNHPSQCKFITSEFLGYDKKPGEIINGIRHENALELSLTSNSIDAIISNDVYEHVPNIAQALKEAHRVLRSGGAVLITIPFDPRIDKSVVRTSIDVKGNITHLKPPVYHSNPIDPNNGSLVFYDYGWDFLNYCKGAGFSDAYAVAHHSILYGHFDVKELQFVALK